MPEIINQLGQPIGWSIDGWKPPDRPPRMTLSGRYCRLEPFEVGQHTADFYAACQDDREGRCWTYLPYGPFASLAEYQAWARGACASDDPLFFAITENQSQRAAGLASYLRIMPESGSIEVGHINYSPRLQRTPAATEAMYLLMKRAFELGYRRYEWKCDALNAKSRRAAQRLGLSFEGIFRQATVYKGRNRDTAWYAAIDAEWPALEAAFIRWLDSTNFDEDGRQRVSLSELTASVLKQRG